MGMIDIANAKPGDEVLYYLSESYFSNCRKY